MFLFGTFCVDDSALFLHNEPGVPALFLDKNLKNKIDYQNDAKHDRRHKQGVQTEWIHKYARYALHLRCRESFMPAEQTARRFSACSANIE